MRIEKSVLESLKAQGVIVSPFPSDSAQDNWIKRYKEYYEKNNRYRSAECIGGVWTYSNEIPDWKERMEYSLEENLTQTCGWWGLWYDSEIMYIRKDDMLVKRSVGKSKLLTEDYILGVLERDTKAYSGKYGQFAKDVQKMFAAKIGTATGFVYPTTYGIGVWVFYNWKVQECIDTVRKVLDDLGVKYENEFSDKQWVYRFKISKEKQNRNKVSKAA